jgi:hypothetical protein
LDSGSGVVGFGDFTGEEVELLSEDIDFVAEFLDLGVDGEVGGAGIFNDAVDGDAGEFADVLDSGGETGFAEAGVVVGREAETHHFTFLIHGVTCSAIFVTGTKFREPGRQ